MARFFPAVLMLFMLGTLCLLSGTTLAQGKLADASFVASLNKREMLTNSTVEFTLTLNNAQGDNLQPPPFRDFKVLNGPSRSVRTTLINGVASSAQSFSWLLQPRREGTLTVEPATIRAGGRTYRSNSKIINVLPADSDLAGMAPANLLRAELSTSRAYVGQQIILNLNLYSTVNVISRNIMREPDFDGFFSQPRRQYDGRPRNVIENGREYEVRTLGSVALFPSKIGRLTITPYDLVVGVVRYHNVGSITRRRMEQLALSSDTLFVDVEELPRPQPKGFSGGVGTYRLDVTVEREELTTDDALTMRLAVTGEGDIKRIKAFDPVDRRNWQIYDPKILQEELLDSPSGIVGRKILEYQLIPKRAGTFTLSPELVYFDVDSASYVALSPENFEVTVAGGTGQPTYELDSLATDEDLQLLPVSELPPGSVYGRDPAAEWTYWLLFLLPLLGTAGAVAWNRYQSFLAGRDPAELARARAAKAATARLHSAKAYMEAGDARAFYDAVEAALAGYLRDKFSLPLAELTRRTIGERLRAEGAGETLVSRYDKMLQRCEMALYAGQVSADDLAGTYDAARQLIIDTDRAVASFSAA